MPPATPPRRSKLALPDWLTTPVGRVALYLAVLVAAVRVCADAELLQPEWMQAMGTVSTLAGCAFALGHLVRLGRSPRGLQEPRRFWRLQRIAVMSLGVAAAAAGGAAFNEGIAGTALRGAALLASFAALATLAWSTVHIPGGEIARRHRVTASLDLATLIVAGLIGFWILALKPAMLALRFQVGPGREGGDMPAALGVVLAIAFYAFFSLLLTSTLVLIPFRSHEGGVSRGLHLLAGTIIVLIVAEVVPHCMALATGGLGAPPVFTGWALATLGIGIHAGLARSQAGTVASEAPPQSRVAMPFAAIGLLAVLIFVGLSSPEQISANIHLFLVAMSAGFILVVVRQTVIARENFGLALEMQRAKEAAESANSVRLQFLANISHDLRTPLNGVLGCTQILLREKTMGSKQRELLKTIQGCAEHLRNLINDLLDLSKLEADKLELAPSPFDLKGLLAALIKTFALEAETKKIALELEQSADLPEWIQCDRKRLQQILGNLVHNAIKFTDHGRVKVRARVAGPALIFDVIDTGCGIMPDKIGELFQPFHVVDERSIRLEGTGLGLSICKKLANKMGGDISVTSKLGKGSTFSVVIPLTLASPVVEIQRTVVDYQGRRRRVLIVDDNPANRIVLRTMLEPLDFLVHEADGAASAHEQISQAQPDIVLMDLMMPGVDGFTLCREIRDMDILRMPVLLAVSAMAGDDVLERCRQAGFADLLNKPVHLDALVDALRVHAGIEWTYGVIHPAPVALDEGPVNEPIVPPSADEITAFLDLARRGVVRNIESRAEELARSHPEYSPFARRVARYARDFKLKELGEWLTSLNTQQAHGSA